MAITQLPSTFHVITPLGEAICYFAHEGDGDEIYWGVFQTATGECWWWKNNEIRLRSSISEGRSSTSPITITPEIAKKLAPHKKRNQRVAKR